MIDWKILAAGFVALLAVSTVLLGSPVVGDFFGGIFEKIRGWFEEGPFKGIFSAPSKSEAQVNVVNLIIYPENFSVAADSEVEVVSGGFSVKRFKGVVNVDYSQRKMWMNETGSSLVIDLPFQETFINNAEFKALDISGTKMRMRSGNWTEATENGTASIYGFSANIKIGLEGIEFSGNATKTVKG